MGTGNTENAKEPTEITQFRGVKMNLVCAGCYETYFATSNNRLFGCGDMALDLVHQSSLKPVEILSMRDIPIAKMSADDNVLVLTKFGTVYAWGNNYKSTIFIHKG